MKRICISIIFLILSTETYAAEQTLRQLAEKHHLQIGTVVGPTQPEDGEEYLRTVDREYNFITPGNTMKWDWVEWTRGKYNYAAADAIISHAQKNNQKVRGHTLVWYNQLPQWVSNGNFSATELKNIMEEHINTEVTHFKGKIYSWDVINEPFEEDGSFRKNVYYQKLGVDYIADALKAAHKADSDAKLYINDYNVEGIGSKSTAMYNLVRDLQNKSVPIHGVGLQAHFILGQVPSSMQQNIERFAALGLEVAITELDVRIQLPSDANKLKQQANDYKAIVNACRAVSKCVGITAWGFTDKNSWIPSFFPGYGEACLFDRTYKPKPAYYAVRDALA